METEERFTVYFELCGSPCSTDEYMTAEQAERIVAVLKTHGVRAFISEQDE